MNHNEDLQRSLVAWAGTRGESLRGSVDASPGWFYGRDGVDVLAVTNTSVVRVRRSLHGFFGGAPATIDVRSHRRAWIVKPGRRTLLVVQLTHVDLLRTRTVAEAAAFRRDVRAARLDRPRKRYFVKLRAWRPPTIPVRPVVLAVRAWRPPTVPVRPAVLAVRAWRPPALPHSLSSRPVVVGASATAALALTVGIAVVGLPSDQESAGQASAGERVASQRLEPRAGPHAAPGDEAAGAEQRQDQSGAGGVTSAPVVQTPRPTSRGHVRAQPVPAGQ